MAHGLFVHQNFSSKTNTRSRTILVAYLMLCIKVFLFKLMRVKEMPIDCVYEAAVTIPVHPLKDSNERLCLMFPDF